MPTLITLACTWVWPDRYFVPGEVSHKLSTTIRPTVVDPIRRARHADHDVLAAHFDDDVLSHVESIRVEHDEDVSAHWLRHTWASTRQVGAFPKGRLMMRHEFDASIVANREAHRRCQVLSGDALSAAQDEEAEALDALSGRLANVSATSARSSQCCRGS
jgi:hypothetical protein